jgi:pimeloyl-ACP methyl ester carboxylesterase
VLSPEHGAGIARRIVRAEDHSVSYIRAGEGRPVVLLHSGPVSARAMLPFFDRLVDDHTVFAIDLPGDGDSDRIGSQPVGMEQLADALAATLAALELPPCPIYGRHTGAALALELGRRHPASCSGLVLDGPCVFSAQEAAFFTSDEYLKPFEERDDGSHLFSTWVQVRDAVTWFPWSRRTARNRLPSQFPTADSLHAMFVDRLRAGDGYRDAYGAAFRHDGYTAARELSSPATFTSLDVDVLARHLDRLPELGPDQRIARYSAREVRWPDVVAQLVGEHPAPQAAPPDPTFRPTPGAVNSRLVDVGGGQVLVRSSGEDRPGRPMLLLHDGRASSRTMEPLMRALARRRPVFAPDLPDNGASDRLGASEPSVRHYADALAAAVASLGVTSYDVYAVGASAGVALETIAVTGNSTARVVLDAPDFYSEDFARRLAAEWAPPLVPQWDGGHLNRLWWMLREEYVFWPWFDKSSPLPGDAPTQWDAFHARLADVLRSLPTYHRLTAAALGYDWTTGLRRVAGNRVVLASTTGDPRRPHVDAVARRSHPAGVVDLPAAESERAEVILSLTG